MQHSSITRTFLLSILILTSALCMSAYDISGRLIDDAGEPLVQASVRLLTLKDSTQVKGSVTN